MAAWDIFYLLLKLVSLAKQLSQMSKWNFLRRWNITIYIWRVAQKERMSLGPHADQIYLPGTYFC